MAEKERPYGTPHPDAKIINLAATTGDYEKEKVEEELRELMRKHKVEVGDVSQKSGGPSRLATRVVDPCRRPEDAEEMDSSIDILALREAAKKQTQPFIDSLQEFGFTQKEIKEAGVDSPFTAFKLLLNRSYKLETNILSLQDAGIRLEQERERKQKAEESFMKGLELAVDIFFRRLTSVDDPDLRKDMTNASVGVILNNLSNKFSGQGYTTQKTPDGLKVTFSDIKVALEFNKFLPALTDQQHDEVVERYNTLRVQYDLLFKKIQESHGVSETQILEGFDSEIAFRQKVFWETRYEGKDQLERMDQPEVIAECIRRGEELEKIKFEMRSLEKIFPGIGERKSARDKFGYAVQQLIGAFEDSAKRVQEYQLKVGETEAEVRQYFGTIFKRFERLGDHLRSNSIVCQIGHTTLNGKSLDECIAAVENEFDQLSQTVGQLAERSADSKEYTNLRTFCDALKKLYIYTRSENARLREELGRAEVSSEEEDYRRVLGSRMMNLRKVFMSYVADNGLSQEDYPILESQVDDISIEGLSRHYVGFLDESLALVRAELASFEEVSHGFVNVSGRKQELADQCGCEDFDGLKGKIGRVFGYVEKIESRGKLEQEFEDFRQASRIKVKTIATIEKHLMAYDRAQKAGEDTKAIVKKLYHKDANPSDDDVDLDWVQMGWFADEFRDFDSVAKHLVQAARELDPKLYKGRVSKTAQLEKARDLVKRVNGQITEFDNQEAQNQEIMALPGYQSFAERLGSLAQAGEFLGYQGDNPYDLVNALENEKKPYASFLAAHRKYQEDKGRVLAKLRPVKIPEVGR